LVGVVVVGTPVGLAGSGVVGLEGAPAFLKAEVDGASLIGVPTLGVVEKGDCVGSSTAMAPLDELFSIDGPETLDRSSGWPRIASACAGSAHLAPIIQLPAKTSPFFLTARTASAAS